MKKGEINLQGAGEHTGPLFFMGFLGRNTIL